MSKAIPSADIVFALLCEDVRREDNGKLIFIGVYGSNVLPASFPAVLEFRVAVRVIPKKPSFPLNFRVKVNGEATVVMKGAMEGSSMNVETTSTPRFALQFSEPAMIEVEITDDEVMDVNETDGLYWVNVLTVPVEPRA